MNGFDIAVAVILLVSFLFGVWRGLVYEVLSLLGWPIAFVLSKLFANDVAPLIPVTQEVLRITVAYALVFIAALIVWGVLVWLLSKLVKAVGLGWLDRVLGGLFGVLRGGWWCWFWCGWRVDAIPEQSFWRDAREQNG